MNLLSCRVFDALLLKERRGIEPYTGEHGTLEDGLCIFFYGIVELTGRVLDQVIQEAFIISQLEEDASLRMPFLKRHRCRIDFSRSAMLMAGRELTCVGKSGCPLEGGVQVVGNCTIPDRSWVITHCGVHISQISRLLQEERPWCSLSTLSQNQQNYRQGPCWATSILSRKKMWETQQRILGSAHLKGGGRPNTRQEVVRGSLQWLREQRGTPGHGEVAARVQKHVQQ